MTVEIPSSREGIEVKNLDEVLDATFEVEETGLAEITTQDIYFANQEINAVELAAQNSISKFFGEQASFSLIQKLGRTLRAVRFREIKESGIWKGYKHVDEKGQIVVVNDWAKFCKLSGVSRSAIDEDIQMLNSLGQDFMQACEESGFGYRKLKQIRLGLSDEQYTDDEQKQIELAKEQGPQALVEVIEDLQDKHKKANKEATKYKQDLKAAEKLLIDTTKELSRAKGESGKNEFDIDDDITKFEKEMANILPAITKARLLYMELAEESLNDLQEERLKQSTQAGFENVLAGMQAFKNFAHEFDFVQMAAERAGFGESSPIVYADEVEE